MNLLSTNFNVLEVVFKFLLSFLTDLLSRYIFGATNILTPKVSYFLLKRIHKWIMSKSIVIIYKSVLTSYLVENLNSNT